MNSQYPTLFQNSSLSVEKDLQRIRSQLLLDKFYIIQAIRRGATRYRTRLSDLLQESYRMRNTMVSFTMRISTTTSLSLKP